MWSVDLDCTQMITSKTLRQRMKKQSLRKSNSSVLISGDYKAEIQCHYEQFAHTS